MRVYCLAIEDRKCCEGIEVHVFATEEQREAKVEELGKQYCEAHGIDPEDYPEAMEHEDGQRWLRAAEEADVIFYNYDIAELDIPSSAKEG